jgi:hypothetical protein
MYDPDDQRADDIVNSEALQSPFGASPQANIAKG